MNKTNIGLLVEMPSTLSHIVVKRGRLLLGGGSSSVNVVLKDKDANWVNASVTGREEDTAWDAAHETAASLKKEFGKDVYIEPEAIDGHFHAIIAPEPLDISSNAPGSTPFMPPVNRPVFSIHGLGHGLAGPGFGGNSMGGSHRHSPYSPNAMGLMGMSQGVHSAPMSSVQNDPLSQFDNKQNPKAADKLECNVLRQISGFSELPETTQKMLEAEAGLIIESKNLPQSVLSDPESLLLILSVSQTSKRLKSLVAKALGAETS